MEDAVSTLQPVVVEICCSSAGLSAALRRLGFQVFAIDHAANRHSPKVRTLVLDVSISQQLELLESLMMFSEPCYVHLGLPCGTCSRARGKPMPKSLGGHMGPQPLRDANNLLGLPQLQGSDLVKVTLANKLYRAAILILLWCYKLGYLVSLENPGRSWLWQLLALLVQETNNGPFIEWYSLLESVYFDVAACVTNAQNFWQPRGCLLLWPWIAPETINMRLGVLFERKLAWYFHSHGSRIPITFVQQDG